jgi:hypothetical protein
MKSSSVVATFVMVIVSAVLMSSVPVLRRWDQR